jgi:hypothetical protein
MLLLLEIGVNSIKIPKLELLRFLIDKTSSVLCHIAGDLMLL